MRVHTSFNSDRWNKVTLIAIKEHLRRPNTEIRHRMKTDTSSKKTHKTFIIMGMGWISRWQGGCPVIPMVIPTIQIINIKQLNMTEICTIWNKQKMDWTRTIIRTLLITRLFCKDWRTCTRIRERVSLLIQWLSSRFRGTSLVLVSLWLQCASRKLVSRFFS